jgi:sulfite reductase (ferredoxin)
MGTTHGQAKTYPRLASPICFATPDEAIDVCTAIVKVQRDFGNRQDRKQARLKYTIDRLGLDEFRAKVAEYYGKPLAPHNGERIVGVDDHLGWHDQGDGKLWFGAHVLSGRLYDDDKVAYKRTIREIAKKFGVNFRVSATQNLLICDVAPADKDAIDAMLVAGGYKKPDQLSKLVRHGMSCVATPTCGLALAESERVFASMLANIHAEVAAAGLDREDIVVHMTGCPNGCARPYNADIGVVGRSPGKYVIHLGGNLLGDALAFHYADLVPMDDIGARLRGPLLLYKRDRRDGEGFGDFCRRAGKDAVLSADASTRAAS